MRVLVGILAIILVSGCSSMGVKPIEIFTTEVERQPLALKPITVEQMEQIQVIIVTSSQKLFPAQKYRFSMLDVV